MSLPVFFHASVSDLSPGARCVLEGDEGHHASVVKRVRAGERLLLTDGRGAVAHVEIGSVERGRVVCRVEECETVLAAELKLTVVQAIPKGDRGELAVGLLTEVGVDQIVPWQAERCVSRWSGPKVERGQAKWAATAREAAKQSRRTWWPEVAPMAVTSDVANMAGEADICFLLIESAGAHLTEAIAADTFAAAGRVVIVVGPEGGVSPAEAAELQRAGSSAVRLGPTVLRTSTAGVVAATLVLATTAPWGRRLDVRPVGSNRDER